MPLLLLQLVFIILKVTETINWSWWVVLIPLMLLAIYQFFDNL